MRIDTIKKKPKSTDTSLAKMEKRSDPSATIFKLGVKLSEHLELHEDDLLGQWMAQYIAELVVEGKTADEQADKYRRDECCKSILQIWRHRRNFIVPPLAELEVVLSVLESLDVSQPKSWRYFDAEKVGVLTSTEGQGWLQRAMTIDTCARSIINYCLVQAVSNASTDTHSELNEWLAA